MVERDGPHAESWMDISKMYNRCGTNLGSRTFSVLLINTACDRVDCQDSNAPNFTGIKCVLFYGGTIMSLYLSKCNASQTVLRLFHGKNQEIYTFGKCRAAQGLINKRDIGRHKIVKVLRVIMDSAYCKSYYPI